MEAADIVVQIANFDDLVEVTVLFFEIISNIFDDQLQRV